MIETHRHDGPEGPSRDIREIRLARPPVNALTPELLEALLAALGDATENAAAVVLSGRPGMFSAGLDVPHLLTLGEDDIHRTFSSLLEVCRTLAVSPVPTVAAVTGHSPAGGAVMAVWCDYRVMAEGKYQIGLNEVQVGVSIPELLAIAVRRLVGERMAERLLVHGRMLAANEALEVGFVDELAPTEEVVERSVGWCRELLRLPAPAVRDARRATRADLHRAFDGLEAAVDTLASGWYRPETQAALRGLVERLAAR
jgi:Delta3-Delta2-enoyl-CoA isomerase